MSDYKIEEGIPIPKQTRNVASKLRKFLQSVPVGASFLLTGEHVEVKHRVTYIRRVAKQSELGVCTRRVDGGVRIWRLS